VGSTATINIKSTARTLTGQYYLWLGIWVDEPNDKNFKLTEGLGEQNAHEVNVSFVVPELPYNASGYGLSWYNARLNAEGPAFTFMLKIEPSLQVIPAAAVPGTQVTIKGNGFTANNAIILTLDGKSSNLAIKTNDNGSFSASYTMPSTIAGQHEFKAAVPDIYDLEAKASLSLMPMITVEPDSPQVGNDATITGRGFAARSPVSVEYDGTVIGNSPTTGDSGSFSYTFKVPQASKSEHSVIATDSAGNKAVLGGMRLETVAPPAPAPLRPMAQTFGLFGSKVVSFAWTDVADPSGVAYTLEIGDNLSFFPLGPGMRKTGLTTTSTVVNLKPGVYYWRVKAVDGAGNESQWMLSPYPFKVGAISVTYLILGAIVLILVIVFALRAAFRKIHEYF
jgi:hypothetical protein